MRNYIYVGIAMCFTIVCDDFGLYFFSPTKYMPSAYGWLLAWGAFSLGHFRLNRPRWYIWVFSGLMFFGIPGLVVNKLRNEPSSMLLTLTMPVTVLAAQFIPPDRLRVDPKLWMRLAMSLGFAKLISVTLMVLFAPESYDQTALRVHERSFLIPLGLLTTWLERRWILCSISVALMTFILFCDPRTTTIVVYMLTLALMGLFSIPALIRPIVVILCLLILPPFFLIGYPILKEFNNSFKTSMGSYDNSEFREFLWENAFKDVAESPIFGKGFAGNTGHRVEHLIIDPVTGAELLYAPLHNDYLEFLVNGGVLGLTMLVVGFVGSVVVGISNYLFFEKNGIVGFAHITMILVITTMTSMFAFCVNPILHNPQSGFFAYLDLALLLAIDRYKSIHFSGLDREPRRPSDPAPLAANSSRDGIDRQGLR